MQATASAGGRTRTQQRIILRKRLHHRLCAQITNPSTPPTRTLQRYSSTEKKSAGPPGLQLQPQQQIQHQCESIRRYEQTIGDIKNTCQDALTQCLQMVQDFAKITTSQINKLESKITILQNKVASTLPSNCAGPLIDDAMDVLEVRGSSTLP